MSRNATIALVQMDCVMLDKEANLQKAKTFIEQAAQQHADLIAFRRCSQPVTVLL